MSNFEQVKAYSPELVVTAGAYSDGDVVGGLLNLSDLAGAGGGGLITQVLLTDDAAQTAVFQLWLFDGEPTGIADNAAFAPVIADLAKVVDVIDIAASDYETVNSNEYALKKLDTPAVHGSGQLYGYLVLNGSTPTYAATSDLTLKVSGFVI